MKKEENTVRSAIDRVLPIVTGVLLALLLLVTVLDRCGLKLLSPDVSLQGGLLLLVLLVSWGLWKLTRRIRSVGRRRVATLVLAFVILLAAMMVSVQIGQYSLVILPQYRRTVTSPGGRTAVVLRQVDMGMDEESANEAQRRMDERRASRLGGEAGEDDPYLYGDYGYKFTFYPRFLGIFYRSRADLEGAVYIGADTQAKLVYTWEDDDTLRVTLENPEVGDEGEATLKFK